MPTENRSSNTEMVSVPREWLNSVALLQMPLDELQEQAIQHLCEPCDDPAQQPHPEPIAWMVGTAFWWTKEEAERDAAATGLPIVGLGPMAMAAHAVQHQGEPLGWVRPQALEAFKDVGWVHVFAAKGGDDSAVAVYTHDDPAEVERLRRACEAEFRSVEVLNEANQKIRAQLAGAQALLRLVRDGNGYLEEQDWERINAITEYGGGEATQSQNVSYERLLREVARELREPSHVGWENYLASRIVAALSASAEPSAPTMQIPEGYCVMPRRLTADNGAKALLLGEFKLNTTHECPECAELEEPTEGCKICDGAGEYGQRHTIPWDQIKFIYSEAVKGLALKQ